jgi:hypothetical protein
MELERIVKTVVNFKKELIYATYYCMVDEQTIAICKSVFSRTWINGVCRIRAYLGDTRQVSSAQIDPFIIRECEKNEVVDRELSLSPNVLKLVNMERFEKLDLFDPETHDLLLAL